MKADINDVAAALALKANKTETYTKTDITTFLSTKADDDEVEAGLALKADKADTYNKTQTRYTQIHVNKIEKESTS